MPLTKKDTGTCIFKINEITEFCQDREISWDRIVGIVFSKDFTAITKHCYLCLWSSTRSNRNETRILYKLTSHGFFPYDDVLFLASSEMKYVISIWGSNFRTSTLTEDQIFIFITACNPSVLSAFPVFNHLNHKTDAQNPCYFVMPLLQATTK